MITDSKKWHYVPVKILSTLLRVVTSKHFGDFYCINYLYITYIFWLFIVQTMLIWCNKKKLDCDRGKDCMERFCKDLSKRAT